MERGSGRRELLYPARPQVAAGSGATGESAQPSEDDGGRVNRPDAICETLSHTENNCHRAVCPVELGWNVTLAKKSI